MQCISNDAVVVSVVRSVETNYHGGWSVMLSAHSRVVLLGLYGPDRGQWRLTRYDLSVPGEESGGSAGAETRTTGKESGGSTGAEATPAEGETRGALGEDTFETKEKTGQNEEMTALKEDEKNVEKKSSTSMNETEGTAGTASAAVEETLGSSRRTSGTAVGDTDAVAEEGKQTSGVGAESIETGTGRETREETGEEAVGEAGTTETENPEPMTCDDGPKFDGEVARVELVEQGRPSGMTEVVLNGKTCIALSYW